MTQRFTVAMMIEALSKLPPDAPLFVAGYEGGYHDAEAPSGPALLVIGGEDVGGVFGPHCAPGELWVPSDFDPDECETATGYLLGPDTSGTGGAFGSSECDEDDDA